MDFPVASYTKRTHQQSAKSTRPEWALAHWNIKIYKPEAQIKKNWDDLGNFLYAGAPQLTPVTEWGRNLFKFQVSLPELRCNGHNKAQTEVMQCWGGWGPAQFPSYYRGSKLLLCVKGVRMPLTATALTENGWRKGGKKTQKEKGEWWINRSEMF